MKSWANEIPARTLDRTVRASTLRGPPSGLFGFSVAEGKRRLYLMRETRTAAAEISQENRQNHPVVQHLQRQVANAFVLYANYKHYHWQTFGPLFRDLHLMFDELAKEVLETTDEFAERIRMIGLNIDNVQLRQFQEAANVHSAGAGQSMREM